MHRVMVGMRTDASGNVASFGCDEVNDYIRHGMKVVSLAPGEVFTAETGTVWSFTVVLNDYGIDPA